MKFIMLEDNDDRIKAFLEVLQENLPEYEVLIWKSALKMIEEVSPHIKDAVFISLDHDLVPETDEDPGDGRDFARFLSHFEPVCPIFIHSTNVNASWSMLMELEDGGWDVKRKPPIGMGEEWIYKYWIHSVMEKLGKK